MPDLHSELNRVLPQLIHHLPKEGNTMSNSNHPDLNSMRFDDEAAVHHSPPADRTPETPAKPKPTTHVYRFYEVLKANPGANAGELYKAARKARINIDPHFVHVSLNAFKNKHLVKFEKRPGETKTRYTATAPEYPTRTMRFDHKARRRTVERRKAIEAAAKALPKRKPRSDRPPVAPKAAAELVKKHKAAETNHEIQLILNTIPVATARKLYDELRKMFGG